jgi:hypothetical protein
MPTADTFTESLFTMGCLDDFVPVNHPLRPVRSRVNFMMNLNIAVTQPPRGPAAGSAGRFVG